MFRHHPSRLHSGFSDSPTVIRGIESNRTCSLALLPPKRSATIAIAPPSASSPRHLAVNSVWMDGRVGKPRCDTPGPRHRDEVSCKRMHRSLYRLVCFRPGSTFVYRGNSCIEMVVWTKIPPHDSSLYQLPSNFTNTQSSCHSTLATPSVVIVPSCHPRHLPSESTTESNRSSCQNRSNRRSRHHQFHPSYITSLKTSSSIECITISVRNLLRRHWPVSVPRRIWRAASTDTEIWRSTAWMDLGYISRERVTGVDSLSAFALYLPSP